MAAEGWWGQFRETAAQNALYEILRSVSLVVGTWLIVEGGWRKVFPPYDGTPIRTWVGIAAVLLGVVSLILQVRSTRASANGELTPPESPAGGNSGDEKWAELVREMREVLADRDYWVPTAHSRGNITRLITNMSSELDVCRDGWMHFGGSYDTAIRDLVDLFDMYSHPSNNPGSGTFWSTYTAYKAIVSLIIKIGYGLEDLSGKLDSDAPEYLEEEYSEFQSFFEEFRRRVDDLDRRMKIETGEEFDTLWP